MKKDIINTRRTVSERIFFICVFAVLFIWMAIVLIMLGWALMSTLKSNIDFVREPLKFPDLDNLRWSNYSLAIKKLNYNGTGFIGMLINSLWLVIGSTFLGTLAICITGYVCAQYRFKGRNIIINIVIFSMIIPIYGSLPAQYKLFNDLHITNSPLILITSVGGFSADMLLTYGFFSGTPKEYREAVYIDGGGDFLAFFKIYLPLSSNIFIAFFLLHFIAGWNNYETPILYLDKMPPLASGLYYFQQEIQFEANNPAYFAGALICMLPILILFIMYSGKIMGKLYVGGLKG